MTSDTTRSLNLSPKDREFTDSLAFVQTLANTPIENWPTLKFLHNKAKEIANVK